MRRSFATLLVIVALSMGAQTARAETVEQAYAGALKSYYAGNYKAAVQALERLVALPLHHEELFYDLGCAYFRLGRLGPAIYNYERALALDAGFEDARYNLELARELAGQRVKDVLKGVGGEAWWMSLVKLLSPGGWWIVFLLCWWLTLGLVLLVRSMGSGPARAGLVATNSFVALLALLAGLLLAGRIYATGNVREGVVLPDKVAVHEGPDATARSTFKLHAGLKVRVRAESSGWVRIRLTNGLEGWIKRADLGML